MTLHPDWKGILKRAWSVKFMLAAGLLSGCEVMVPMLAPLVAQTMPQGVFAALAGLVTAGALISRILAQGEAKDAGQE